MGGACRVAPPCVSSHAGRVAGSARLQAVLCELRKGLGGVPATRRARAGAGCPAP